MLLKKYKNRKLYSPDTSKYINFCDITDENIEKLYVVCDKTKEDITVSFLSGMLASRIISTNFPDAMSKSIPIITRLNHYTPNLDALTKAKKSYFKYSPTEITGDLKEITA